MHFAIGAGVVESAAVATDLNQRLVDALCRDVWVEPRPANNVLGLPHDVVLTNNDFEGGGTGLLATVLNTTGPGSTIPGLVMDGRTIIPTHPATAAKR